MNKNNTSINSRILEVINSFAELKLQVSKTSSILSKPKQSDDV